MHINWTLKAATHSYIQVNRYFLLHSHNTYLFHIYSALMRKYGETCNALYWRARFVCNQGIQSTNRRSDNVCVSQWYTSRYAWWCHSCYVTQLRKNIKLERKTSTDISIHLCIVGGLDWKTSLLQSKWSEILGSQFVILSKFPLCRELGDLLSSHRWRSDIRVLLAHRSQLHPHYGWSFKDTPHCW